MTASASVTICVASLNTRRATEVAIRSLRATTGGDVTIRVGDCGSIDGSLRMLERALARGTIDALEVEVGRSHGAWIDHWRATATTRWLVVADSDVELQQAGWLPRMVAAAEAADAGLVTMGVLEAGTYTQPDTFTMRTVRRPEMYLVLVDRERTAAVDASFGFELVQADDGEWYGYDTGARFAAALDERGIAWTAMPSDFGAVVRHWGALSYMADANRLPTDRRERRRVLLRRKRIELDVAQRLLRWRLGRLP